MVGGLTIFIQADTANIKTGGRFSSRPVIELLVINAQKKPY